MVGFEGISLAIGRRGSNICNPDAFPDVCKTQRGDNVEIIVFTNTGKTYHFKNVENLTPTTQGFEFDYTGLATGVKRHAAFNYTSVAGYATA